MLTRQTSAAVEAGPTVSLMEDEEPVLALTRQRVEVVGHTVESVDEETGDVRDGLLTLERDPDLLADSRVPAIRTDDERSAELASVAVVLVAHGPRRALREIDLRHSSDHRRACGRRSIEERLACVGMTEVERPFDAGDHDVHGDRHGSGNVLVVLVPHRGDVRASGEEHVFDAERSGLSDAPRLHALAAHAVRKLGRGLEHRHTRALSSERVGQGGAGDSSADDDDISGRGHARVQPSGRHPASDDEFACSSVQNEDMATVVLVEGASDQCALLTLASRLGCDLDAESVSVVSMDGATNIGHFLRHHPNDVDLAGLYDVGEERVVRRALERAGRADATSQGLEALGFYRCVADLEDELIRALGTATVEQVIAAQGEMGSFRTFQKQPAKRTVPIEAQLRRFLGTTSGRKLHYARVLVEALDLRRVPPPLDHLLARVAT